ncbi:MAG: hypothetical protein ABMA00_08405 [Gemmatimonas sp.]
MPYEPPSTPGDDAKPERGDDADATALVSAPLVIRSHLSDIGAILDLPTKRPTRNTAAIEAIEVPRPVSTRIWSQWLSVGVLVVSALIVTVSFWPASSPTMPESLLGDWVTSHPQYADRHLAFTPTEVLISTGDGAAPVRHPIMSLQLKRHADSTVIALIYKVGGSPVEMHAAWMETGSQRLVFDRPAGLTWERPAVR